jgi:DNA modification methylase
MDIKDDVSLAMLGFSVDELDALLNPTQLTDGLTDEDAVPEVPIEPTTKLGDIYQLGNHRLMCGDSTSIDAVEKLLDGKRPDMVFTDPPYNIDYQGVKDKRDKIKNDKMSDESFKDFLIQSLYSCETMYVCCSWQYAHLFKEAMEAIGRKPKAMIVWDKVNPAQHLDKYFKQHELIFYYGDFGGHKTIRGDVWTLKRQRNTVHPTMKPVELIELALNDQSDKKIILDLFGGSGSTLIAAEKIGRQARLMELDPKYCDVIIKRWEDFTGQKAVLL